MERELINREKWLATTLRSIGDAVITIDKNHNITFMNPVAEKLTGWRDNEAWGRNLTEVFKLRSEKTRRSIEVPAIKAIHKGSIVGIQGNTLLISKNGSEIPIGDSGAPIVDDKGNILGAVMVFHDIRKQKRNEEKQAKLIKELERTNEEIKNFVQIVSHDLKTPLNSLGLLGERLSTDCADKLDEEGKEVMNLLIDRIQYLQKLVHRIIQSSKVESVQEKFMEADLNSIIREVIDIIAPPKNIRIKSNKKLPTIWCEKTWIERIFLNLIENAVKFMDKPNGIIRISCVEDGEYWKFSVTDNGPGIAENKCDKLFQKFNTLRNDYESERNGVGLSLVKKIINRYGGKIWVESKLGYGSTFFFTLPKNNAVEDYN
jgi:PAS domain S-box-containing protein